MAKREKRNKIGYLFFVLFVGVIGCGGKQCPTNNDVAQSDINAETPTDPKCALSQIAAKNSYKLLVIEHILLHVCHTGLIYTASEFFAYDDPEVADVLARGNLACQDAIVRWKKTSPKHPSTWEEIANKIFKSSQGTQNLPVDVTKGSTNEGMKSSIIGYYCAYGAGLVQTLIQSKKGDKDKPAVKAPVQKAMKRCRYQVEIQGIVDLIDKVVIEKQ